MAQEESNTEEEIDRWVSRLKDMPQVAAVLDRIKSELSPSLKYHSYSHTEDVFREAVRFALADGLSERELQLLALAAAFHDAGFIVTSSGHEDAGAKIFAEAMEGDKDFTEDEVASVKEMILDTKLISFEEGLKQVSRSPLSRYLLDADLSNLGREDFLEKLDLSYKEAGGDWDTLQEKTLSLLKNHQWLTDAAKKIRQDTKEKNIKKLEEMITSGK